MKYRGNLLNLILDLSDEGAALIYDFFSELESSLENPWELPQHKNDYVIEIVSKMDPMKFLLPVIIAFHGLNETNETNENINGTEKDIDKVEENTNKANAKTNVTKKNINGTKEEINKTKVKINATAINKTSPIKYPKHLNYTISIPFHPRLKTAFETNDRFDKKHELNKLFTSKDLGLRGINNSTFKRHPNNMSDRFAL